MMFPSVASGRYSRFSLELPQIPINQYPTHFPIALKPLEIHDLQPLRKMKRREVDGQ